VLHLNCVTLHMNNNFEKGIISPERDKKLGKIEPRKTEKSQKYLLNNYPIYC
jgi:hypothetical protein